MKPPTKEQCICCNKSLKEESSYRMISSLSSRDGNEHFICNGCALSNSSINCDDCGTYLATDDISKTRTFYKDNKPINRCVHCNEYHDDEAIWCSYHNRYELDKMYNLDDGGSVCKEGKDHTNTCTECGRITLNSLREGLCGQCYFQAHDPDREISSSIKKIGVCDKDNTYKECLHKLTYGVEIETSKVKKDNNTIFNRMRDGSISAWEYVSPILKGDKGLDAIKNLLEKDIDASAKNECGLHLHMGGMKETDIPKLMMAYKMLEPFFYKTVKKYRATNQFCKVINESAEKVSTVQDVERILYNGCNDASYSKKTRYGSDRYIWVNFHSFFFRKTLEIRLHHGTTSYEEIKNWVNLNGCFITWVMKNTPSVIRERFASISIPQTADRKTLPKEKMNAFIQFIAEISNKDIANYYAKKVNKYYGAGAKKVRAGTPELAVRDVRELEIRTI